MKNLNYKWVLLIGAVLGLIVGTYSKDDWEIISDPGYFKYVNHTTGEVYYKDMEIIYRNKTYTPEWRRIAKPIRGIKSWFE